METTAKPTQPIIKKGLSKRRELYDKIALQHIPFSLYYWQCEQHQNDDRTITRRLSQFCISGIDIESLEEFMENHLRIVNPTTLTTEVIPYILLINDDPAIIELIISDLLIGFLSEYPPVVLVVRSESDALRCLPLLEWFTPQLIILDIMMSYRSSLHRKDAITSHDFSVWGTTQLVSSSLLFDSFQQHGYIEAGSRLLCLLIDRVWCPPIIIFDFAAETMIQKSLEHFFRHIDARSFTVATDFDEPSQLTTFVISDVTTQAPIHTTSIQQVHFRDDLLDKKSRRKFMPPLRRLGGYIEEIFKKR